ncbi:helix-turn-helix domain-containing protein [Legionella sp. 27cVA30]|uniref:helix-turn-helix domain-containing protein n=1 Tax=Legionella sp. 27cVA30 TaxID=2905657 RepID=UPI003532450E
MLLLVDEIISLKQGVRLIEEGSKLTFDTLNRKEKKALVIHLHRVGAFSGKNSAQYIAEILNVSRATIYNYLGCLES